MDDQMSLFKEAIYKGIIGIPLGISLGYTLSVVLSLLLSSDGEYLSATYSLINYTGNESIAVLIQIILFGVMGYFFSATSIVWKVEKWSYLKQNIIYIMLSSIVLFSLAKIIWQDDVTLVYLYSSLGVYAGIIILIGIFNTIKMRKKIREMNGLLKHEEKEDIDKVSYILGIISILIISASIYLIGKTFFFIGSPMHLYTPDWAIKHLLLFVTIISLVTVILRRRNIAYFIYGGYILGMILGEIFGFKMKVLDPRYPPMPTHDGWLWSIIGVIVGLVAGIIFEKVVRHRKSNSRY